MDDKLPASPLPSRPGERPQALAVLCGLYVVNCLIVWGVGLTFVRYWQPPAAFGLLHFVLAFLSHFASLQLLIFLVLGLLVLLVPRRWVVLWVAPLLLGLFHFLFYLDGIVYALYRFHFNGSVVSLLTTPGVGDSLQFSVRQYAFCVAVILGLAALSHFAARWFYRRIDRRGRVPSRLGLKVILAVLALALAVAAEKAMYAVADALDRRDVMVNARVLPFYQPATSKKLARRLGLNVAHELHFDRSLNLNYPLAPVRCDTATNRLNIVWIAIEEWRFDTLNAHITPRMTEFGRRSLVGMRHFSSGNTTRFGLFGMFYGLDGFYWHPFLVERQGPVLFTVLKQLGYDIRVMGSANFDNPEFRLTCFADLGPDEIRDHFTGSSCDRDIAMTQTFENFLAQRDTNTPFFAFMFYDSPHAYHFKELPGLQLPFEIDNALTVSYEKLARDPVERDKAYRRFQNSLTFTDFLIGHVLDGLAARNLLANTVIMIAGDHGEEFGEAGYCGHNSAFNDWQARTGFLFYYPGVVPGMLEQLTSHVDWTPTTLQLLGCRTPPAQYCQGVDMLSASNREYVVCASWADAAIITRDARLVFPLEAYRLSTMDIYDAQGRPLADRDAFIERYGYALRETLEASRTFKR